MNDIVKISGRNIRKPILSYTPFEFVSGELVFIRVPRDKHRGALTDDDTIKQYQIL